MADILVLTTGGTIDKLYFDALSEYKIGDSVVDRLLAIARVKKPFRVQGLMRKDSLELDDADRASIVKATAEAPENHIIITHGTDTMTETAKALAGIARRTSRAASSSATVNPPPADSPPMAISRPA